MKKKRSIPTISFTDINLKQKKNKVYKSLIRGIIEALETNLDEIKVCEIRGVDAHLTIHKDDWLEGLNRAMKFYIEREKYEKCAKINILIEKIKTII